LLDRPKLAAGFAVLAATFLIGCTTNLKVWRGDTPVAGVPFRGGELFVRSGLHNKHSEGGGCDPTRFYETVVLPTGALYYANVDVGQFSKGALTVKLAETGVLTELSTSSEPSPEAIKAATDAATALLPFVGLLPKKATTQIASVPPPDPAKACDVGEDDVHFESFADYQARHPPGAR
jgi:hypothetical protein